MLRLSSMLPVMSMTKTMSAGVLVVDASEVQDFEKAKTFVLEFLRVATFCLSSSQVSDWMILVCSGLLSMLAKFVCLQAKTLNVITTRDEK